MNASSHDEEYDSWDEEEQVWYLSRKTRRSIEAYHRLPMARTLRPFPLYEDPRDTYSAPFIESLNREKRIVVLKYVRPPTQVPRQDQRLNLPYEPPHTDLFTEAFNAGGRGPGDAEESTLISESSDQPKMPASPSIMVVASSPEPSSPLKPVPTPMHTLSTEIISPLRMDLSPKPAVQTKPTLPPTPVTSPEPKTPDKLNRKHLETTPKRPETGIESHHAANLMPHDKILVAPAELQASVASKSRTHTIIPVWPASDGVPSTRFNAGYHQNDLYFEERLAVEWMKHRSMPVIPGVKYKLDRLPQGYSGWIKTRVTGHKDWQSTGHPSGKPFASIPQLWEHCKTLAASGAAKGCGCKLCVGMKKLKSK